MYTLYTYYPRIIYRHGGSGLTRSDFDAINYVMWECELVVVIFHQRTALVVFFVFFFDFCHFSASKSMLVVIDFISVLFDFDCNTALVSRGGGRWVDYSLSCSRDSYCRHKIQSNHKTNSLQSPFVLTVSTETQCRRVTIYLHTLSVNHYAVHAVQPLTQSIIGALCSLSRNNYNCHRLPQLASRYTYSLPRIRTI